MKVSRAKSIENRELILETAARMFREHGFDGIGINDLMKNAGLTVGGFYNNFKSKEDLIAQSCQRAAYKSITRWKEHIANPDVKNPLKRIASSYLSAKNRDDLASTCIYSTVAVEVPRREESVRKVFSDSIETTIEVLSTLMPGDSTAQKREQAIAMFTQWIGALILSRASAGKSLSDEILEVARNSPVLASQ
jgi:TetR/AcrR family transcriptional regulator, transcriptional repressor for nem operon